MHKPQNYRILFAVLLVAMVLVSAYPSSTASPTLEKSEMRCGWFSNPTPANASLFDNAGEWIIGVQGGYQAEGDWPAFSAKQWVETNGHYGYGCACLRVRVNRSERQIIAIESAQARELSVCRRDRALRKWGFK
ncbi:MAG TPA: DUF4087 domain-containing protein [Pyrinomonadaceae bacterium]|nr:DUF4087 domain-containing protein [Pyrinomonadaceae bacterium]